MSYKKMVAIFVDVIGYKNITDFSTKHELHRLFHEEVAIHEQRQKEISHVIYDRKVFGFSDCAYFFFYYKDGIPNERKNDINLSYIAAYNVSLTILRLMSKGFLARGGVSFGDVFIDELGFFGPAVERAHEIESKEVIFPRLQFDQDLGKNVFEWEHDLSTKDPDLISMYTEVPFVSEIERDAYFVNPFNVLQRSGQFVAGTETLTIDAVKNTVIGKIEADLEKFSTDLRVVEKLEWLKKYVIEKKQLLKEEIKPDSFSFMTIYNRGG
ncbi:hypothetical protein [Cellvibrio japonicus]|uniref:Guanylate cyclase domain-containing protein n=1 Tax=Cellvibrio japonicus (strain Ueda107) TaxID=498211 RepID=B3PKQ8_CELJU|nr:hypothetical protein [Cellvibrio japonicus]ACE85008.1 hypothetical protein CJA_0815 [Cellvibrio japonicus Ueda107]QEI11473.1 hypothetical protein FY117_03990 [Cellvibrio japonicus]QEI15047.1 hypothetical protein FY116_03990 [Cellvibrio japonicus]QEI18627.1 hypothetical protein FY115_03990 [Cellvibrio japonicus]